MINWGEPGEFSVGPKAPIFTDPDLVTNAESARSADRLRERMWNEIATQAAIGDTFATIIREHMTRRARMVESVCVASMTDPLGRGVLVIDYNDPARPGLCTVGLSAEVPPREIHYKIENGAPYV